LWEDIEQTAEGVMENEKKLRYAAALFALNTSAAFWRMQKGRTDLGSVEYKLMFLLYMHGERFSSQKKKTYYITVSLYVQTFIMVSRIKR